MGGILVLILTFFLTKIFLGFCDDAFGDATVQQVLPDKALLPLRNKKKGCHFKISKSQLLQKQLTPFFLCCTYTSLYFLNIAICFCQLSFYRKFFSAIQNLWFLLLIIQSTCGAYYCCQSLLWTGSNDPYSRGLQRDTGDLKPV